MTLKEEHAAYCHIVLCNNPKMNGNLRPSQTKQEDVKHKGISHHSEMLVRIVDSNPSEDLIEPAVDKESHVSKEPKTNQRTLKRKRKVLLSSTKLPMILSKEVSDASNTSVEEIVQTSVTTKKKKTSLGKKRFPTGLSRKVSCVSNTSVEEIQTSPTRKKKKVSDGEKEISEPQKADELNLRPKEPSDVIIVNDISVITISDSDEEDGDKCGKSPDVQFLRMEKLHKNSQRHPDATKPRSCFGEAIAKPQASFGVICDKENANVQQVVISEKEKVSINNGFKSMTTAGSVSSVKSSSNTAASSSKRFALNTTQTAKWNVLPLISQQDGKSRSQEMHPPWMYNHTHGTDSQPRNTAGVLNHHFSLYGHNVYAPASPVLPRFGLRPIVIDGNNVAFGHGLSRAFSSKGIAICVHYFVERGHEVVTFVPEMRKHHRETLDRQILLDLEARQFLVFTPSRSSGGFRFTPYDDRYIVQFAAEKGGVVVSRDHYNDLLLEDHYLRDTIRNRLLPFTWVGDTLMFPRDPLGKFGPTLERFLSFP